MDKSSTMYKRIHQFPRHRSMTIASFDKIFPCLLSPKRTDLTSKQDSHLVDTTDFIGILDSFSVASLTDAQTDAIMKSENNITGYDFGHKYKWHGSEFPIPPRPIDERIEDGRSAIQAERRTLTEKTLPYSRARRRIRYDELRHTLANAIKATVALHIAEQQEEKSSEEDKQKECDAWDNWMEYLFEDDTAMLKIINARREKETFVPQEAATAGTIDIKPLLRDIADISVSHPEICDELRQLVNKYK